MITQKTFFLYIVLVCMYLSVRTLPLTDHFKQTGYVEICDTKNGAATFDALYQTFDEFVNFFQTHPTWAQKLYSAKERFIRSRYRRYYSTDFFGLFDESERNGRNQIAFYYSSHFHAFLCAHFRQCCEIPHIMQFLNACAQIQKAYEDIFTHSATQIGAESIFSATAGHPPLLLKVIKYLPAYRASRPHYDGSVFSLFLDSTDNQSLLLSPYKDSYTADDFFCPARQFARGSNQSSLLLIPGTMLAEYSIKPTPHIVMHSSNARYATIAFAMRPDYSPAKIDLTPLPSFKH